jgi:Holliday junction resolvase-like predicted endonuclease
MLNAKHAALAEDVVAWLLDLPGWEIRPEVSFNVAGERGVIDLLAWHAATHTLLVVELKTDIVDVGELIGTFDRKRRLAWRVAASVGWRPEIVGAALLIRETTTNRRRVAAVLRTLRAALPDDQRRLRAWLSAPAGPLGALAFVPDRHQAAGRQAPATLRRVRLPKSASGHVPPSVPERGGPAGPPPIDPERRVWRA